MTEKRRSLAERIDEVYETLKGRGPVNLLELAVVMNMSPKYLIEEIIPASLFVHKDIQMQMVKDGLSTIYILEVKTR